MVEALESLTSAAGMHDTEVMIAWHDFSVNSIGILLKLCMVHCYCWNLFKCFNSNGTHQFSLWRFFSRWPSFSMKWDESFIMRSKGHLIFIASFVKSWSGSGSPALHTLYWWLFSWPRSVPWRAYFPTLFDSFDSFLSKGHNHFEEDCIPDPENSSKYIVIIKDLWINITNNTFINCNLKPLQFKWCIIYSNWIPFVIKDLKKYQNQQLL